MTAPTRGPIPVVLVRLASWLGRRDAHPENVMAPLDLGYCAALLADRGHPVTLIDTELGGYDVPRVVREAAAARPGMVVVQGITSSVPEMLAAASRLRAARLDATLVAVGQHATVLPGTLLRPGAFDACALREFEETVADLAAMLPDGDPTAVPGLVVRDADSAAGVPTAGRPLRTALDELPPPDHARFMDRGYRIFHPLGVATRVRWGFLLSSRGCPFPCSYCSPTLRNSYGTALRLRSPASVADEARGLVDLGATALHFKDDVFTLDRDHVLGICEALRQGGLRVPWTAQTRADLVDAELLRVMREAGCTTISFGVESGSPQVLERLDKRMSVDEIRAGFRAAREAGLLRVGFFMLGCPGETARDREMTLALCKELDPDIIQVAFLTPYPGSTVWNDLPADARPGFEDLSHYNVAAGLPDQDPAELRAFQRRFYRETVLRPSFLARYAWIRRYEVPLNLGRELAFFGAALHFLARR